MERNKFFELCQKCAVLPERICGIKKNIPVDLMVQYDGKNYYPVGCIISFDNSGAVIYTAILHDLYANSISEAKLGRVCHNE